MKIDDGLLYSITRKQINHDTGETVNVSSTYYKKAITGEIEAQQIVKVCVCLGYDGSQSQVVVPYYYSNRIVPEDAVYEFEIDKSKTAIAGFTSNRLTLSFQYDQFVDSEGTQLFDPDYYSDIGGVFITPWIGYRYNYTDRSGNTILVDDMESLQTFFETSRDVDYEGKVVTITAGDAATFFDDITVSDLWDDLVEASASSGTIDSPQDLDTYLIAGIQVILGGKEINYETPSSSIFTIEFEKADGSSTYRDMYPGQEYTFTDTDGQILTYKWNLTVDAETETYTDSFDYSSNREAHFDMTKIFFAMSNYIRERRTTNKKYAAVQAYFYYLSQKPFLKEDSNIVLDSLIRTRGVDGYALYIGDMLYTANSQDSIRNLLDDLFTLYGLQGTITPYTYTGSDIFYIYPHSETLNAYARIYIEEDDIIDLSSKEYTLSFPKVSFYRENIDTLETFATGYDEEDINHANKEYVIKNNMTTYNKDSNKLQNILLQQIANVLSTNEIYPSQGRCKWTPVMEDPYTNIYIKKKATGTDSTKEKLDTTTVYGSNYCATLGKTMYFDGGYTLEVENEVLYTKTDSSTWPTYMSLAQHYIDTDNIVVKHISGTTETDITSSFNTTKLSVGIAVAEEVTMEVGDTIVVTYNYYPEPTYECTTTNATIIGCSSSVMLYSKPESGDSYAYYDYFYDQFFSPISYTISYNGGFVMDWDCMFVDEETTTATATNATNSYTTTNLIVNKQQGYVEATVSQLSNDIKTTESRLQLSIDNITATVGTGSDSVLSQLKEQVNNLQKNMTLISGISEFSQTEKDFNAKIKDIIGEVNDSGELSVTEIVTKQATLDDNGITISSDEGQTKTTLDEDGMVITNKASGEAILSAVATGTDEAECHATNLIADTWLKVGNFRLANVSDGTSSRVGFYFVGGAS